MRTLSLAVFAGFFSLALAQIPSDVFDKAPPAIDDALRTRVEAFYQAHVDGKFRAADQYVAEDSKDAFFAAEKTKYKGFQVSKITYSDNFTKANVVTNCKTDMFFHGSKYPVTMPTVTHWKIDQGQWFWSYVSPDEMDTPFGTMKGGPPEDSEKAAVVAMIPKDFNAAAKEILSKVTVDRSEITLDQDRTSSREVHLKNGLLGPIKVSTDPTGIPGLTVRPAKPEVGPGEEVAVIIEFNFEDPSINCRDCLVHPGVRPPATVNIHVQPTQQEFPIRIVFTQQGSGK